MASPFILINHDSKNCQNISPCQKFCQTALPISMAAFALMDEIFATMSHAEKERIAVHEELIS